MGLPNWLEIMVWILVALTVIIPTVLVFLHLRVKKIQAESRQGKNNEAKKKGDKK